MKYVLLIIILVVSCESNAAELFGSKVGAYVGASHTEPLETVQLGITLEWRYAAVDLSHGIQKTQWRVPVEPEWEMDKWQSGSTVGIRIYPFNTKTFRPLLSWTHVSDIMRGRPFNGKEEPTSDFYGAGVTILLNKRIELDIVYGAFGRECHFTTCADGSKTNEVQFNIKGYFWR